MTISYNVTLNGIIDHLREHFYCQFIAKNVYYTPIDKNVGNIQLSGKDMYKLGSIIHNILYDIHPDLKNYD